jgi:hypothetical protein
VFTTYVVTKEDIESVGELPSGGTSQSEMATLSKCGGSSRREIPLWHRLSERAESYDNRKAQEGDQVTVPNVKPFELTEVKALKPGSEAAAIVANEVGEQDGKAQSQTGEAAEVSK